MVPAIGGCSTQKDAARSENAPADVPATSGGVVIPAGSLPSPDGGTITLPGGGEIHLVLVNGVKFIPIEGTFSENSYQAIISQAASNGLSRNERDALLQSELDQTVAAIGKVGRVLQASSNAAVGYFNALIPLDSFSSLGSARGLSRTVLINPVVSTPFDDSSARRIKGDQEAGLTAFDDPRIGTDAFSGLKALRIKEFMAAVVRDTGIYPDGSNVLVGVTDTGVTYNHPTFEDDFGNSRVLYMKDFTGEGRIYFHPTARFDITVPATPPAGADPTQALTLTAEFLVAPRGITETPVADKLSTVTDLPILVGPELYTILTTPGSGARLGVLNEDAYNNPSAGEAIDINANGKIDDKLWVIYVPGKNGAPDAAYVDLTTHGDFRQSVALTNFNTSKVTQKSFAERFGLDYKPASLLDTAGNAVKVVTATVVGYDPGNHGSHVSGIIAGRQTLANDLGNTMARGGAPAAKLMVDRICANSGGCRGTEAIIDLAQNGAEVINMSIGGLSAFNDGYAVQETIINRLTAQYNTLFTISAGNDGPGRQTVGSPSVARFALSVGATASRSLIERQYQWPGSGKLSGTNDNDDDFMLFFSSRGPTAAGGFKPDLTAPGTELSSVQLNAPPGARAGLDVYWGTSMAAPSAAGAVALLIDAAKRFNAQYPFNPLALDAFTLRRILVSTARPFDVNTFDTQTGETKNGQYTWIDQGAGMINLPAAWDALRAERLGRVPAAITYSDGAMPKPVNLDYQVRVLRTNPNGIKYDGSSSVDTSGAGVLEARFGRGIWLDTTSQDSLIPVQIARRLPTNLTGRDDVGDLTRLLETTSDEFVLKTVIHGSHVEWLKAGTLQANDCVGGAASHLTIVGTGATDQPIDPATGAGGSVAGLESTLYVCVNRALVDTLPAGDHGAVITAYRTRDGAVESQPSFSVPVYLTVPHKTLAGQSGYKVQGSVPSFGVARNYVNVPAGTNLVKVTLEVPPATVQGTAVTGCAAAELMALEGGNTIKPPELASRLSARARNCSSVGVAGGPLSISYTRAKPTPGIWDLHVFGLYQFINSPYTLSVEYAKINATPSTINANATALNGSIDVNVVDASFPIVVSGPKSKYRLTGFTQVVGATVATGADVIVPDADGSKARSYAADIGTVTIATGGSTGNDIDLTVRVCDDVALTTGCKDAGSSGGATDVETVTFKPVAGKYYYATVNGYDVTVNGGAFKLTETQNAKVPESGTITATAVSATAFKLDYAFPSATSALLVAPRFTSSKYAIVGEISIADDGGVVLVRVPVNVTAN